jgi:hypothetical protein
MQTLGGPRTVTEMQGPFIRPVGPERPLIAIGHGVLYRWNFNARVRLSRPNQSRTFTHPLTSRGFITATERRQAWGLYLPRDCALSVSIPPWARRVVNTALSLRADANVLVYTGILCALAAPTFMQLYQYCCIMIDGDPD